MKLLCLLLLPLLLNACSTLQKERSLFSQLGAKAGIAKLTDAFIEEIQYDKQVLPYFLESDIHRFRSKFIEQVCMISGGPCEYTGDSMENVHAGMQINEHHFNALVDDLIRAMEAVDLPVQTQNQLLSLLTPMRKEIIYR